MSDLRLPVDDDRPLLFDRSTPELRPFRFFVGVFKQRRSGRAVEPRRLEVTRAVELVVGRSERVIE